MSHFRLTRPDSLSIDRLDNLDAESPFHGWLQSKKRNRNETKRNKQKRNETKQKRNRIKQKRNEAKQNKKIIMTVHLYDKWLCKTVHDLCLFLQTGNMPSSSSVSIRISNLTSQIDIEWSRLLFHGLLGDRSMVWVSTVLKTMRWLCWPSLPGEGIWYQSNIFLLYYESQKFT